MAPSAVEALLAALPEPVLMVDGGGIVTAVNPAAQDLFGAGIRGAPLRAHLRNPEVASMLDRVQAGAPEAHAAFVRPGPHSESTWRAAARRMDARTLIVSLHDVSDLEAAEAQRRDFVANVSHELRSPLTVLTGFIETLKGPASDDPETRAEFLGIMAREAERMTGLVSDLLSLSRVETSERIRPRTPVSLPMVIHATLAALRPQLESAGLRVSCQIPEDLPEVPGDYDQLVQVYHNLIENAVHYGRSGGRIEIRARLLDVLPGFDGPAVHLAVRDFGEGIDPIHIPRLTERFYRVDSHRSRQMGGTGLGLAIVKHIVNRHRGRLVIESERSRGSTFMVILPRS